MSATGFLLGMARFLASARLYGADHAAVDASLDEAYRELRELLERSPHPSFSIFKGKVICDDAALPELDDWEWTTRLGQAGFERIEFTRGVERDELREFLDHVSRRVERSRREATDDAPAEAPVFPHVDFGPLGFRARETAGTGVGTAAGPLLLTEEAETLAWLHRLAATRGRIPAAETVMTVHSLSLAVHQARKLVVPFLELKKSDQYTASHGINVAVLSMRLAEEMGQPSSTVLAVGAGGLLHDIGKVEVPSEILDKPGELSEEEAEIMQAHPVEGCRILLRSGPELSLPAMVAYEHHMHPDREGGYPRRHYDREILMETRLVQVCDFYDAIRARRAYASPLPPAEAADLLREARGKQLDPRFLDPFLELLERWDPSTALEEVTVAAA